MSVASAPCPQRLSDEQLLERRISSLGLTLEGTPLQPLIQQLYNELSARGLAFYPPAHIGDEWFVPIGIPAIFVPFFLVHDRLRALERSMMLEVEGETPEWFMKLMRHEAGHAYMYAYRLTRKKKWQELFGETSDEETPSFYRPRPFSRSYVMHLDDWYAQAHPDEDFAETFAVWLATPPDEWRQRYHGWKALEKLEYVDTLMREAAAGRPAVTRGRRISEARKLRKTLAHYYTGRRKLYAEDFPDFYDADLRAIFWNGEPGSEPAARVMRKHRGALTASIVQATGQRKYTVSMLVRKLMLRCQELKLTAPQDPVRLHFDLAAYLSALVTNHLYTGRFKRSV